MSRSFSRRLMRSVKMPTSSPSRLLTSRSSATSTLLSLTFSQCFSMPEGCISMPSTLNTLRPYRRNAGAIASTTCWATLVAIAGPRSSSTLSRAVATQASCLTAGVSRSASSLMGYSFRGPMRFFMNRTGSPICTPTSIRMSIGTSSALTKPSQFTGSRTTSDRVSRTVACPFRQNCSLSRKS